jgi:selenocysteine lyase/cysteine desulfurase
MDSHPDHWFRRQAYPLYREALTLAADFVGADVEDLVFVINATQGD